MHQSESKAEPKWNYDVSRLPGQVENQTQHHSRQEWLKMNAGLGGIWMIECLDMKGDWILYAKENTQQTARRTAAEAIVKAKLIYQVRIRRVSD